MNVFKSDAITVKTVAGALNKSYMLQVSLLLVKMGAVMSCPVIKRCPEQNCVLRSSQNASNEETVLTLDGREFQAWWNVFHSSVWIVLPVPPVNSIGFRET